MRLRYDDSLFAPPTTARSWPEEYVASGVVAPVTALSVGDARVPDPSLEAARAFGAELIKAGIDVRGPVSGGRAPAGATELGGVDSRPLAVLVARMLTESDNDYAEAFGHLSAVAAGEPATFDGGATATIAAVRSLGVPTDGVRLSDASGLARDDAIPPRTLATLLATAGSPEHPELGAVLPGLPVSGFTGTLLDRFLDGPQARAAGLVRAKTGTLTGVSTLAGTVIDREGRVLAFAFLADRSPDVLEARASLDRSAAALAACGCR